MDNFFQGFFQVFFLVGYLVVFVVSIIILKPFRMHRHRPKSTIAIKLSYLIYLVFFLMFTFLLLFGEKELSEDDIPYDTLFNKHFIIFMTSTIIPNLGIMLRRQFRKKRLEYNMVFTLINLAYSFYLLYAISSQKWALM